MKTGFILITDWDLELYDIFEPLNECRGRETGNTGVKPGFVDCHGLFVGHINMKAMGVPIWG